jgi:hypothetical protein
MKKWIKAELFKGSTVVEFVQPVRLDGRTADAVG